MKLAVLQWIEKYLNTFSLFILLFVTTFAIPFFSSRIQPTLYKIFFAAIFFTVVMMAKRNRKIIFLMIAAALALKWFVAPRIGNVSLNYFTESLNMFVFLYAVGVVILAIAQNEEIDEKVILDAISGYLLIGLAGAAMIQFVEIMQPGSFSFHSGVNLSLSEITYFAFVTLSTLGYGDIVPQTPPARSLAIFIGTTGQMYVAVVVALLVGKVISKTKPAEKE